jgi:predicted nucleotidyltransferase
MKKKLIIKYKKRGIPFYKANFDNEKFREYKKISVLYELNNSGLIEFLWNKISPEAIVLYGSYSKGESIENSDIDLFVIGKEKEVNIDRFEKMIGVNIHILFEENIKKIPNELKNNLINGIILRGYLKIF